MLCFICFQFIITAGAILKGAKLVKNSKRTIYYEKSGGYTQAAADFESLAPSTSATRHWVSKH